MNTVQVLSMLLIFLASPASAEGEISGDQSQTVESINELTRKLNQLAMPNLKSGVKIPRQYNDVYANNGERLYNKHCSRCHGENAHGAPNWHLRDDSGNFKPPPLDGTAHTWHHPRAQLIEIIRNGSIAMPSFKLMLNAEEIGNIIHWLQTFWPDDLYQIWATQNAAFEKNN